MPVRFLLKDAFYELVAYPVRGAALANRRYFMMEKSAVYAAQGRASASQWADAAKRAGEEMVAETDYYNERLAGGKWRHIMAMEMQPGQWQSMRITPPARPPELARMSVKEAAGLGVAIEGRLEPLREGETDAALPVLNVFTRDVRFIDVFNIGRSPAAWTAQARESWIKLNRTGGDLLEDVRILVSVDWTKAPKGVAVSGSVEITGAGAKRVVRVPLFNPPTPRPESLAAFVESGGVVSIEAEHFTGKVDRGGAGWRVIPGLGRTGDCVAVFPTSAPSVEPERSARAAPLLEYRLYLFRTGELKVTYYLVPTHPLRTGGGLRFAIGLDDEKLQAVAVDTGLEASAKQWSQSVLNASAQGSTTLRVNTPGPHVLKIYMIDPGVVLDKIVIDTGGARPSYLGPKETRVVSGLRRGR